MTCSTCARADSPVVHAIDDGSCCNHYADVFNDTDLTFVCPECKRTVGYCMGADDDYPDLCADCWAKHAHDEDAPTADEIAADLAPLSREEYR
jgi:hypothetical protein